MTRLMIVPSPPVLVLNFRMCVEMMYVRSLEVYIARVAPSSRVNDADEASVCDARSVDDNIQMAELHDSLVGHITDLGQRHNLNIGGVGNLVVNKRRLLDLISLARQVQSAPERYAHFAVRVAGPPLPKTLHLNGGMQVSIY